MRRQDGTDCRSDIESRALARLCESFGSVDFLPGMRVQIGTQSYELDIYATSPDSNDPIIIEVDGGQHKRSLAYDLFRDMLCLYRLEPRPSHVIRVPSTIFDRSDDRGMHAIACAAPSFFGSEVASLRKRAYPSITYDRYRYRSGAICLTTLREADEFTPDYSVFPFCHADADDGERLEDVVWFRMSRSACVVAMRERWDQWKQISMKRREYPSERAMAESLKDEGLGSLAFGHNRMMALASKGDPVAVFV